MQPEGRLKENLGSAATGRQQEKCGYPCQYPESSVHGGSLGIFRPLRKPGSLKRGMFLVEAALSLSILTVIGLILLKLSLNILEPRQWTLQQTVTDAHMTYERAYAERVPFETLTSVGSPWPVFPSTSTTSLVEIGRLPGSRPITGTITRFRIPDPGNYPIDGGSGTLATNPAAMKIWQVQSVLTYRVGNRTYAKSRTVLRSQ